MDVPSPRSAISPRFTKPVSLDRTAPFAFFLWNETRQTRSFVCDPTRMQTIGTTGLTP
jgi:hypothetical protein